MSKTEQIRKLVQTFQLPSPQETDSRVMWFKPDRGSPNYFRLVPTDDDAPQSMYYDVWVEADLSTDKIAAGHLHIEAVLYDGARSYRMDEEDIANVSFSADDEPTKQTILNNWDVAYRKRAKDAISRFSARAEANLLDDLESNEDD